MPTKIALALALTCWMLVASEIAHAGASGGVVVDSSGRTTVGAKDWMDGTPQSSGPACSWRPGGLSGGFQSGQTKFEDGRYYPVWVKTCPDGTVSEVWVPDISPGELAKAHEKEVIDQIPALLPQFAPPLKPQYKGYPTHIWFTAKDLKPVTVTASVPQISITLTATPINTVFNSGSSDGDFDCTNVPKALGECDFTYKETSKDAPDLQFEAGVTVRWKISYSVTGGAGGSVDLKPFEKTTPIRIMVAKIQAVGGAAP
jgi:hypothetical protein